MADSQLIYGILAGVIFTAMTSTIFYEILRLLRYALPKLKKHPRLQINLFVFANFMAHSIGVLIYAAGYDFMENAGLGAIAVTAGEVGSVTSYIYFSASTYSSLGYGDIYPTGALRIVASIEVLNGLMMIGWSVSITYIAMQKFWDFKHFSLRR